MYKLSKTLPQISHSHLSERCSVVLNDPAADIRHRYYMRPYQEKIFSNNGWNNNKLCVNQSTISRDLQLLRKSAKKAAAIVERNIIHKFSEYCILNKIILMFVFRTVLV